MTAITELPATMDIDFLPERFHEQDAQRKVQKWRVVTIGLLVILFPIVSFAQMRMRRSLENEIAALSPMYDATQRDTLRLKAVEADLQRTESAARLLAYLHHPWPRSQVLSALLPAMPNSITLMSIQMDEVGSGLAPPPAAHNLHQENEPEQTAQQPTERDLKALRNRHDKAHIELIITGVATDPAQLHGYLGELSRNRLFVKAELVSLESVAATGPKVTEAPKDVRFRARLVLSQGYGQPKGPQPSEPETPSPHAVASKHGAPS